MKKFIDFIETAFIIACGLMLLGAIAVWVLFEFVKGVQH